METKRWTSRLNTRESTARQAAEGVADAMTRMLEETYALDAARPQAESVRAG